MSRLHFILSGLLALVVSALGLERRSKQWLKDNGFSVEQENRNGHVRTMIWYGGKNEGIDGRCAMCIFHTSWFPVHYSYLHGPLSRLGFHLTLTHEKSELRMKGEDENWTNIEVVTTELAPPTHVFFVRPWWV